MNPLLDSFAWLLLTLMPLLWLRVRLHQEVQSFFLLLTHRPALALLLFSLLFFPGVLLHELSHFLMAKLLGVPTGRFSLLPKPLPNGRLQMGYVEVASVDPLRETFIGAAPLLTGGAFVAYAGLARLGLDAVWAGGMQAGLTGVLAAMSTILNQPDVWLWLYLTITVSSMMFPSASDRKSWLAVGLILIGLLLLALVLGAGGWLLATFGQGLTTAVRAMAVVFAISASAQLLTLVPLAVLRYAIERIFGFKVVRNRSGIL